MAFTWEDPLLLNEQLTEDERMIADAARAYAREKLLPRVLEANRKEHFDPAIMKEMGEMGLFGVTIKTHGCAGASHVASGLICREIEWVDSYRTQLVPQDV